MGEMGLKSRVFFKAFPFIILATMFIIAIYSNSNSAKLTNTATLYSTGVGAFSDTACTHNLTELNWGTIYAGDNKTLNLFLRNEGNTNINLSYTYGNWTPAKATNIFTLEWSYTGIVLGPNSVYGLSFTLCSVYKPYPEIDFTEFRFDIVITANNV